MKRALNKGVEFELHFSSHFHSEGVPLLVSPKFLRNRNCGQIDLAIITQENIVAAECKAGDFQPSNEQRRRLLSSCKLFMFLFSLPVELITVKRFAKSFESAYPFKRNKIGELR